MPWVPGYGSGKDVHIGVVIHVVESDTQLKYSL
jgi:hypothetical protein